MIICQPIGTGATDDPFRVSGHEEMEVLNIFYSCVVDANNTKCVCTPDAKFYRPEHAALRTLINAKPLTAVADDALPSAKLSAVGNAIFGVTPRQGERGLDFARRLIEEIEPVKGVK